MMNILGAGMAGLLAAHYFRDYKPVIRERQESLPQNHTALFRLRSDAIGRITGVPLRKVTVHKAVLDEDNKLVTKTNLLHANAYSYKVLGKIMPRSVLNLETVTRWVPEKPETFLADMAKGLDIRYGYECKWQDIWAEPTISTLPLPFWWQRIEFPATEFAARPTVVLTVHMPKDFCDVYQTVYVPFGDAGNGDVLANVYRASITGNVMIIETNAHVADPYYIARLMGCYIFGFDTPIEELTTSVQSAGKIAPIDDTLRKRAIIALTDKANVISLGRFATWRNLVMDDLVNDLEVIRRLLDNPYAQRLHYAVKE